MKDLLLRFQQAYLTRDITKIENDIDTSDTTLFLGTGNEELCLGYSACRQLLVDDFKYWGDVTLDVENYFEEKNKDVTYFKLQGSVQRYFIDSKKRDQSYQEYIYKIMDEPTMEREDKLALLNLALGLTYHRRKGRKRRNTWPLTISGVVKNKKITFLHFGLDLAPFPHLDSKISNINPLQGMEEKIDVSSLFHYPVTITQQVLLMDGLLVSGYFTMSKEEYQQAYFQEIQHMKNQATLNVLLQTKQALLYALYNTKDYLTIPFRATMIQKNEHWSILHLSHPHYYIFEDLKLSSPFQLIRK